MPAFLNMHFAPLANYFAKHSAMPDCAGSSL